MDIIGIISIIVAILIALIPYYRNKYVLRPEITIEIKSKGGMSNPLGLSPKNEIIDGVIDANNAIRIFRLTWRFEIILTNNSNQIAFYPEYEFNPNGRRFTKIDNLDKLKPIIPAERITLKAEYVKIEEKIGRERTDIGAGPPNELKELSILISYQNSRKTKYFTLFDNLKENHKMMFLMKKPKEFKNN